MNHLLRKRLARPLPEPLHEGERGYGAWHYSATAGTYHGVAGSPGAMDGVGPNLGNDDRLLENHLKNLRQGRPLATVVQDLLETGKHKKQPPQPQSPYERAMAKLAAHSKLDIYRGPIR